MPAFDLRFYDSIGSTNDEARRLAQAGAADGTVVWAREQTAGRGRQGRHWHSPAGNLYASILQRLDAPAHRAAELSLVAALAVVDTTDEYLSDGARAELKWPNDVLVRGSKIAGILLEGIVIEGTDGAVVIGIGINLRCAPPDAPYPVTCLAEHVAAVPEPAAMLQVLLRALAHRLAEWRCKGFARTRSAWLARGHPPGSPLRVNLGDRAITGRFAGLADDGALLLATADGTVRVAAGDVADAPR